MDEAATIVDEFPVMWNSDEERLEYVEYITAQLHREREAALEDAAKVCVDARDGFWLVEKVDIVRDTQEMAAKRIRALKAVGVKA